MACARLNAIDRIVVTSSAPFALRDCSTGPDGTAQPGPAHTGQPAELHPLVAAAMNKRELAYELARWTVAITVIALAFMGVVYILITGGLL